METTWLGKAEARGRRQGRTEAMAEAVEQMRQAVLQGLERRFGAVPQRVRRRLESIHSIERLAELVAKLPSLEAVDDLLVPSRAA